jgi:hypothetical protein
MDSRPSLVRQSMCPLTCLLWARPAIQYKLAAVFPSCRWYLDEMTAQRQSRIPCAYSYVPLGHCASLLLRVEPDQSSGV